MSGYFRLEKSQLLVTLAFLFLFMYQPDLSYQK
jgi:hypothetical protein